MWDKAQVEVRNGCKIYDAEKLNGAVESWGLTVQVTCVNDNAQNESWQTAHPKPTGRRLHVWCIRYNYLVTTDSLPV